MRQYPKLVATVILIGLIALGADYWQTRLIQSAAQYRSPLRGASLAATVPLPRLGTRVVLIIISGVGANALDQVELTTIERLRESGADAVAQSQPPTYLASTWLTLVSGAGPVITDEPPLYPLLGQIRPAAIETLFELNQTQGQQSALLAQAEWQDLIPAQFLDYGFFTPLEDEQGDQQFIDRLKTVFEDERFDLVVIHFNSVNYAAEHLNGTAGEAYQTALQHMDEYLNTLLNLLDLDRTTVIITADHGHIEQGGYGGHDPEVTDLPLILFGRNVIPGDYSPVSQADIAPTIAALLGLSLPPANQGRPLLEMLDVSNQDEGAILVTLARQHQHLTEAYFQALNLSIPEISQLDGELDKAQAFLNNKNYDGAAQLAQLLMDQTDQGWAQADNARAALERRPRFWLSLTILVLLITFSLWRRSELFIQAFLAAALVVGLYHFLHRAEDLPFSFSAIATIDAIWLGIGWRMLLSLLAGILFFWVLLILQRMDRTVAILQGSIELIFFVALGFLIPALYGFWQNGWAISWYFPPASLLFWHYTTLIAGFWGTALGFLAPLTILPLNRLAQKWIAAYQHRQFLKLQTRSTKT